MVKALAGRRGNGSLRIGVSTYEINATEIHGDERLVMMEK